MAEIIKYNDGKYVPRWQAAVAVTEWMLTADEQIEATLLYYGFEMGAQCMREFLKYAEDKCVLAHFSRGQQSATLVNGSRLVARPITNPDGLMGRRIDVLWRDFPLNFPPGFSLQEHERMIMTNQYAHMLLRVSWTPFLVESAE